MSGGAGSVGGSGGYGQQPMGNASAQPGGGGFGPGVNNFGGGMGNASARPYDPTGGAPQQSTNQSNFGQGMNTMFGGGSPFGMQQQQPYGMQQMQNPFGGQQLGPNESPGYGMNQFQQQQQMQNPNGPSQPTPMQMPQPGSQTPSWAGGYLGQQQQMPQQGGQRPAYMDNPDFQAYQKQEQDLGRQMNEYMQKAPMFQQMQDLQGKLRGFQQPQGQMGQNPYGNIDQMQQQRNMQDQQDYQQRYQQATQEDARRGMTMDMPPPGTFGDMRAAVMPQQGQMGDTGFNRAMPAVMPPQATQDAMLDQMTLYSPETYGDQTIRGDFARLPSYGGGYGRGGYGGGRGQQPDIGIGDFMRRQLPGYGGGRGGYGQQMPQQDYGYGQMQNQMRQQAAFGQQQRQQYGGLDALQQYLQPPSYRPPVVAPLPLDPGLTNPKPPPPPPPTDNSGGTVGTF